MDNKKFEQLINLIINENEEAAKALLHDIVVEKSREIYESMMDMDEEMLGGQVGDMMNDIESDETGDDMGDEDDMGDMGDMGDEDSDEDMGDEDLDIEDEEIELSDDGDEDVESRVDDLEDRVVSAEERLDRLMAEFEQDLAGDEGEEEVEVDAGEEETEEGPEDEEEEEEEEEETEELKEEDEDEEVMESLSMVPVKKVHNTSAASHGPARTKPGIAAKGAPVNFSNGGSTTRATPKVSPGKQYGNTGLGHKVGLSAAPSAQRKPTAGSGSKSPLGGKKI